MNTSKTDTDELFERIQIQFLIEIYFTFLQTKLPITKVFSLRIGG